VNVYKRLESLRDCAYGAGDPAASYGLSFGPVILSFFRASGEEGLQPFVDVHGICFPVEVLYAPRSAAQQPWG